MNRNVLIVIGLVALVVVMVAVDLARQGSLRKEMADEATISAASGDYAAAAQKLQDSQATEASLRNKIAELESKLAAAKAEAGKPKDAEVAPKNPKAAANDPDKAAAPADAANDKIRAIMAKLGSSLPLGEEIPEDAVKALGLDPGQVTAVNIATKDEEKRMAETLQRFYAENFKSDEPGLYEKPGNEVMRLMLGKVMAEVMELSKLPPGKALEIHTGESSLEELLGPDKVASKLAREIHAQRLKTYEKLATSITPDQLAKFRDEYWREGSLYYPGTERYEFGMAPKDMKK